MFKSKYSNVLTIILIALIILILVIGIILFAKWYKQERTDKMNEKVIGEFMENNKNGQNDENEGNNTTDENEIGEISDITNINTGTDSTSNTGTTKKNKTYLNGFVVIGYIEIPKTGIKYAILETSSIKALEVAVAVAYPSNPKLNTPGNIVIQGHNYRNGKFFSNNKNLSVGDKIKITDTSNKTLTYTIYEIFQTTSEDAEYMTRDTGDNIEISLSTCTDDSKGRLVILARV